MILKGTYTAKWIRGEPFEGVFRFKDDLKFEKKNWDYCLKEDRRFFHEVKNEIETHTTVHLEHEKGNLHDIPPGTYDVNEGYYEPIYSIIYTYDGKILRTPDKKEVEFIMKKCRYNPNKLDYIMTGVYNFYKNSNFHRRMTRL